MSLEGIMDRFKKNSKKLVLESYDKLLDYWDVSKEEREIQTSYGMTHVIITGKQENPPLLLFHGVGDNSALMWIFNATYLSQYFWLIAVDVMGGPGKSEPNQAYYQGFEQCTWILEILDSLKLDKVDIAGVSNGSYLARYFTAKNPNRVKKVVCMAGGVTLNMFKMMTVFLPEALFPNKSNTKKLLKKLSAPTADIFESNEHLLEHWNLLLKYFNNHSMMYHKYTEIEEQDFVVLREKALFLIGEYDRLTNYPKSIEDLKKNKLHFKIIKDAGHGINHEQSDLINHEIVSFLLQI